MDKLGGMSEMVDYDGETQHLRDLSARLGRNPLLVQASTGNTSVKAGDRLWIKASGQWLIQAEARDFLVGVSLRAAVESVWNGLDVPTSAVCWGDGAPSIETAMHAVLPHRVVLHVHSVNAIAWAVREDGPKELGSRLRDIRWQWIPYRASGIPLAKEIEAAVRARPATDVFVLANHGLVVCGESCRAAENLLAEVEARIAITPRPQPEPRWPLPGESAPGMGWIRPDSGAVHALALDPVSRKITSEGVLYPCQAIFLPDTVEALRWFPRNPPAVRVIEGEGVLFHPDATRAQQELAWGLAETAQRIHSAAPLRYLTPTEVSEVRNGQVYQTSSGRDRSLAAKSSGYWPWIPGKSGFA